MKKTFDPTSPDLYSDLITFVSTAMFRYTRTSGFPTPKYVTVSEVLYRIILKEPRLNRSEDGVYKIYGGRIRVCKRMTGCTISVPSNGRARTRSMMKRLMQVRIKDYTRNILRYSGVEAKLTGAWPAEPPMFVTQPADRCAYHAGPNQATPGQATGTCYTDAVDAMARASALQSIDYAIGLKINAPFTFGI